MSPIMISVEAGDAPIVEAVGSRQDLEAMIKAIAFHQLRPVIAEHFPFERLPDALRCLERGRHLGKIVIDFQE